MKIDYLFEMENIYIYIYRIVFEWVSWLWGSLFMWKGQTLHNRIVNTAEGRKTVKLCRMCFSVSNLDFDPQCQSELPAIADVEWQFAMNLLDCFSFDSSCTCWWCNKKPSLATRIACQHCFLFYLQQIGFCQPPIAWPVLAVRTPEGVDVEGHLMQRRWQLCPCVWTAEVSHKIKFLLPFPNKLALLNGNHRNFHHSPSKKCPNKRQPDVGQHVPSKVSWPLAPLHILNHNPSAVASGKIRSSAALVGVTKKEKDYLLGVGIVSSKAIKILSKNKFFTLFYRTAKWTYKYFVFLLFF